MRTDSIQQYLSTVNTSIAAIQIPRYRATVDLTMSF